MVITKKVHWAEKEGEFAPSENMKNHPSKPENNSKPKEEPQQQTGWAYSGKEWKRKQLIGGLKPIEPENIVRQLGNRLFSKRGLVLESQLKPLEKPRKPKLKLYIKPR